jgi:hypothetical protein
MTDEETRAQRDKKLRKKRAKMPQHGKSLAQVYKDAAQKHLKTIDSEKKAP